MRIRKRPSASDGTLREWSPLTALRYWVASDSGVGRRDLVAPSSTDWCKGRLKIRSFRRQDWHLGSLCCNCGSSWTACARCLRILSWPLAIRETQDGFRSLHSLCTHDAPFSWASTAWWFCRWSIEATECSSWADARIRAHLSFRRARDFSSGRTQAHETVPQRSSDSRNIVSFSGLCSGRQWRGHLDHPRLDTRLSCQSSLLSRCLCASHWLGPSRPVHWCTPSWASQLSLYWSASFRHGDCGFLAHELAPLGWSFHYSWWHQIVLHLQQPFYRGPSP